MVHADDLICVLQLMSGEQALAAQIGGSSCVLPGSLYYLLRQIPRA